MTSTAIATDASATLEAEVQRLQAAAVDAICPTRALRAVPRDAEESAPLHERIMLRAQTGSGEAARLAVLAGAHQQLAEKVGIPKAYYDRMLAASPELLCENINHWFNAEPQNRLLRMMRPITETDRQMHGRVGTDLAVRAVLGDKYRPLDYGALLNVALPVVRERGGRVESWSLTETQLTVKFVGDRRPVREMQHLLTPRAWATEEYREALLNEMLSFGATVRNSETGHASLSIAPLFELARCTNQYVVLANFRAIHLGGKQEGEVFEYREDTRRLEDSAVFLKARDQLGAVFAEATHAKLLNTVASAYGEELTPSVPVIEFLGNVGKRFELTEKEIAVLQEETVAEVASNTGERGLPSGRGLTQFAVAQGMTALAKRADTYERRVEIEQAGWRILEDPLSKLIEAGKPNRN